MIAIFGIYCLIGLLYSVVSIICQRKKLLMYETSKVFLVLSIVVFGTFLWPIVVYWKFKNLQR